MAGRGPSPPQSTRKPALSGVGARSAKGSGCSDLGDATLQARLDSEPLLLGFILFPPTVLWGSPLGLPFADLCHVGTCCVGIICLDEVEVTPIVSALNFLRQQLELIHFCTPRAQQRA